MANTSPSGLSVLGVGWRVWLAAWEGHVRASPAGGVLPCTQRVAGGPQTLHSVLDSRSRSAAAGQREPAPDQTPLSPPRVRARAHRDAGPAAVARTWTSPREASPLPHRARPRERFLSPRTSTAAPRQMHQSLRGLET